MVDLFCTKRLFLQETAFFPDYFTRDKNGRNSFSKEFSCSCAINKFRTATLCRILNYSAEHFKMPGNYSISSYLLRIEKKRHFLKKQANTSKEYRRKICKSFTKTPTFAVHFVRVLWVCPPRLYSTTCQYPAQKGKFLRVLLNHAPNSTQLHPAPPSSIHIHPAHFNLHPAPSTSTQ